MQSRLQLGLSITFQKFKILGDCRQMERIQDLGVRERERERERGSSGFTQRRERERERVTKEFD
jgi:hypothetical protein